MERLTRRLADGRACFKPHLYGHTNKEVCDRLAAYEETGLEPEEIRNQLESMLDAVALYFETTPDRLRELAQADRLLGKKVYEPNKRGFVSTYEVISVHISYCSVLVGWNLIDGIYSNLNGFEISALGKSVFLTRKEAEAALRREQDGQIKS